MEPSSPPPAAPGGGGGTSPPPASPSGGGGSSGGSGSGGGGGGGGGSRRTRGAPIVTLTRRLTFASAHALANPALPPAESAALYGRCAGLHGHNYTLWVSCRGAVDPVSGMVVGAASLKEGMAAAVADLDHADLGCVPELGGVSTVERLAVLLWERLAGGELGEVLSQVELAETENIRAVYRGEVQE